VFIAAHIDLLDVKLLYHLPPGVAQAQAAWMGSSSSMNSSMSIAGPYRISSA
jgi:hypothetical protein